VESVKVCVSVFGKKIANSLKEFDTELDTPIVRGPTGILHKWSNGLCDKGVSGILVIVQKRVTMGSTIFNIARIYL